MASAPPTPQRAIDRLQRRELPAAPARDIGLRNIPAWALSLLMHVSILATISVFWVSAPGGTGGEPDRPVGIAVAYEANGSDEYFLSDGGSRSGASDANAASNAASQSLPGADSVPTNTAEMLNGLLPGADGMPSNPGNAAGALGLGDGNGKLGGSRDGPKVNTKVFDIEGYGSRFVYVFDRSDSMNGNDGRPLAAAKKELLQSLESLGKVHQFQIIFYNDSPLPFGGIERGGPRLLRGDEQDKRAALGFVRDIRATGSTRHLDALRMALRMNPDVIFFLTDADSPALTSREIEDLQRRADTCGATIHAIHFGEGAGPRDGNWIQALATATRGKYRYFDVNQAFSGN